MKEINLKNAMAEYISLQKLSNDLKFYRSLSDGAQAYTSKYEHIRDEIDNAKKQLGEYMEPIDAILGDVQKKCTARTITALNILEALTKIEKRLEITKKAMDGITVSVDVHGQTFPGAYHGTPESTIFCARYKAGSWRITDIRRDTTRGISNGYVVNLTEAAKAAIIERMSVFG